MQNLKTITVNAVTLPQVTYKGQPVVTAGAIAAIHRLKDASNVRMAFNLNKTRFMEGLHYFKLSPAEAKELGFMHTASKVESKIFTLNSTFFRYASSGMVLFTKAGYMMLVKVFGDDTAWDIQRQLVDYFTLEASTKRPVAFAGIALQDTPSLPDGDHLRTAMALPRVGMPVVNEDVNQEADALMFSLAQVIRRMKASAGHTKTLSAANNALTAKLDMAGETFVATHEALMAANARISALESENAALRRVTGDLEKFNKIKDLLAS